MDAPCRQVEVQGLGPGKIFFRKGCAHLKFESIDTTFQMEGAKFALLKLEWSLEQVADLWAAWELDLRTRYSQDYFTPAWQLTRQLEELIAAQCLVGPNPLEADPNFAYWWSGESEQLTDMEGEGWVVIWSALLPTVREIVLQQLCSLPEQLQDRWVILTQGQVPQSEARMLRQAASCIVLPAGFYFYTADWWHTGSKQLCGGMRDSNGISYPIQLWTARAGRINVSDVSLDLGRMWTVPWTPRKHVNSQVYLNATPSGRFRKEQASFAWTDGSVKMSENGLSNGAGFILKTQDTEQTESLCIGGEPNIMRGEAGAITQAIRTAPKDGLLIVFTDSLGNLQNLNNWTRQDFRPYVGDHPAPDILEDQLDAIRQRTGRTLLIKVRAHTGDPGNEIADFFADRGTTSKTIYWECEGSDWVLTVPDPAKNCKTNTKAWTKQVQQHCQRIISTRLTLQVEQNPKASLASQSLIRKDRARPLLAAVMMESHQELACSCWAKRDMLLARSNVFPTNSKKAKWFKWDSAECTLCEAPEENFGHIQLVWPPLAGSRTVAHDLLVDQLYEVLLMAPGLQVWKEFAVKDLLPGLDGLQAIRNFRPDLLAWHAEQRKWFVLEVTRGIDLDTDTGRIDALVDKDEDKQAKYHELCLFLQRHTQWGEVEQLNFVMGIKGSIVESKWRDNLWKLGIPSERQRNEMSQQNARTPRPRITQEEALKAMLRRGIEGTHKVCQARYEALKAKKSKNE